MTQAHLICCSVKGASCVSVSAARTRRVNSASRRCPCARSSLSCACLVPPPRAHSGQSQVMLKYEKPENSGRWRTTYSSSFLPQAQSSGTCTPARTATSALRWESRHSIACVRFDFGLLHTSSRNFLSASLKSAKGSRACGAVAGAEPEREGDAAWKVVLPTPGREACICVPSWASFLRSRFCAASVLLDSSPRKGSLGSMFFP